jgi:transcription antitermination factor NusG
MNFSRQARWYAVQTKTGRERFAVSHLGSRGVEVFLPELKREGLRAFPKTKILPLFPGYFFALFCPLIELDVVRYSPGVLRVVGTTRWPIPVEDDIMQVIRDMIQEDGYARLVCRPLQPGDPVLICNGAWEGTTARFEQEWDDGRRVSILLDTIHRARVLIDRHSLVMAG